MPHYYHCVKEELVTGKIRRKKPILKTNYVNKLITFIITGQYKPYSVLILLYSCTKLSPKHKLLPTLYAVCTCTGYLTLLIADYTKIYLVAPWQDL